ncbi:MAG: vanadium-dependent haloperoxidase [Alphaproteobacteria bacterium]|nr:vanadium-dependent haloperoxidase [Alphaproteobacteria bacterium]
MHDYTLFWNAVALELNRLDHTGKLNAKNNRGPTRSSWALAITHLAMHDAFFGRTGAPTYATPWAGLQGNVATYLNVSGLGPVAFNATTEGAAVSGAASAALKALYPSFEFIVDDALNAFDFGQGNAAFDFGVEVGKAHLSNRANDGSDDGGPVPQLQAYWRHREDPTNIGQGFLGQRWGQVKLFSTTAMPPLDPHPAVRTPAYDRDHDLVRVKGSAVPGETGTPNVNPPIKPRNPFETLLGLYWAYDGASQIGTPPRLYNQVVRQVLVNRVNGADRPAASARLFALINVAMADAGIAAWYHKYRYQLWRPILGIREYDSAFWNERNCVSYFLHRRCDPFWTPLGAPRTNEPGQKAFTPPFPAYPSGHATFGAAAFEITRLFFGVAHNAPDTLSFSLVSDEMNGRSIAQDGSYRALDRRSYPSLLHAIFENSISRLFLGVHWRFDGLPETVDAPEKIATNNTHIGGVPLGRTIAKSVFDAKMAASNAPQATVTPVAASQPPCP